MSLVSEEACQELLCASSLDSWSADAVLFSSGPDRLFHYQPESHFANVRGAFFGEKAFEGGLTLVPIGYLFHGLPIGLSLKT